MLHPGSIRTQRRWFYMAAAWALLAASGPAAISQPATPESEWRQVGGSSGWNFYSPVTLRPPLAANTYEVPLVGYRTALVAAADQLYLVELHRATALRMPEDASGYFRARWEQRTRPTLLQSMEFSPLRAVAMERGLVTPLLAQAMPEIREDVLAGLETDTGKRWFEFPARSAEKAGVVLTSRSELLVGHMTSKPRERSEWRLSALDADRGTVNWSTDGAFMHSGEIPGTNGWLFAQARDVLTTLEPGTHRQRANRYARVGALAKASGGSLFLTDYDSAYKVVRCVDRAGKELWQWKAPARTAVRAISPGVVIAEGGGQLSGLDFRTGRLLWQRKVAVRPRQPEYVLWGKGNALDPFAFTWSARIVVGAVLYYTSSSTGKNWVDTLTALDVRTGKQLWTSQFPHSLETLIAHRGRLLLLARAQDGFRSLIIELVEKRAGR